MRAVTDRVVAGLSDSTPGLAIGIEGEMTAELIDTTMGNDVLNFWPWVNQVCYNRMMNLPCINQLTLYLQTPLTVSPQLPLEIVMQLFKRMG